MRVGVERVDEIVLDELLGGVQFAFLHLHKLGQFNFSFLDNEHFVCSIAFTVNHLVHQEVPLLAALVDLRQVFDLHAAEEVNRLQEINILLQHRPPEIIFKYLSPSHY